MPLDNITYIGNKTFWGIEYDWNKIRKLYKSLECPKVFYNPCKCPFENSMFFVLFSARSVGKSTNWLLFGMCMNWLYGTVIQYIRQNDEQIAPKYSRTMFDPIIENKYIEKLTNNKWNSCIYEKRRWYYAKYDKLGMLVDKSKEPFCVVLNVRDFETTKSSYNAPTGDLIIFDEFVNSRYYPDEFVSFMQLVKTIQRERRSVRIVMLSNNTDRESPYFSELEIYEEVRGLPMGCSTEKTTIKGTNIYIEYITASSEKKEMLNKINSMYYGFQNKRISSITGEGWDFKPCQRLPKGDCEIISNNLYIYHNNRYLRLDILRHPELGTCMNIHWAKYTFDDSVILTLQDRTDPRYLYALGGDRIEYLIRQMKYKNMIYYASDDVYAFFENYLKECGKNY